MIAARSLPWQWNQQLCCELATTKITPFRWFITTLEERWRKIRQLFRETPDRCIFITVTWRRFFHRWINYIDQRFLGDKLSLFLPPRENYNSFVNLKCSANPRVSSIWRNFYFIFIFINSRWCLNTTKKFMLPSGSTDEKSYKTILMYIYRFRKCSTISLVVTKYSNEASIQTHEQLETSHSRLVQLRRITQKFRFHWIFQTLCTLERARTERRNRVCSRFGRSLNPLRGSKFTIGVRDDCVFHGGQSRLKSAANGGIQPGSFASDVQNPTDFSIISPRVALARIIVHRTPGPPSSVSISSKF